MPGPSEKTIRRLFAMSGNMCAFPGCATPIFEESTTLTGEICHIRAQSPGGPRFDATQTEEARHAYDNLILLCRRHHKVVDSESGNYPVDALAAIKAIREAQLGRPERDIDTAFAKLLINAMPRVEISNNSGHVVLDSPGAIVAGTVNMRGRAKAPKFQTPPGTIGADQDATRYVHYLIKRYNEFASADTSRATKFAHGAISKNIEARFGASWRELSMQSFTEVCQYLQDRISKTRVAKSNAAKGHRSFSTFETYLREKSRAR